MKKIGVIGHFAFGKEFFDGQTVKTKILTKKFEQAYGEDAVLKIDTYGGMKSFIKIILKSFGFLFKCDTVVLLPAQNGVITLLPYFVTINFLFRKRLTYSVIGGWLANLVSEKKWLMFFLRRLDGIYVETSVMKGNLEKAGLNNVHVLPNPKDLNPLSFDMLPECSYPIALCTFSRVMEQKGIEEAIRAVKTLNEKECILTLDIYGPVDSDYEERFNDLQKDFPDYIRYLGSVESNKSVSVLQKYALQLFPTKFYTEGIPGAIIDGYYAGVPVVSAKWESFSDVVEDGTTGVGYEFGDYDDFLSKLKTLVTQPYLIAKMKRNALENAYNYQNQCEEKIQKYFFEE